MIHEDYEQGSEVGGRRPGGMLGQIIAFTVAERHSLPVVRGIFHPSPESLGFYLEATPPERQVWPKWRLHGVFIQEGD